MTAAATPEPPAGYDHDPVRPEPPKTFYSGVVKIPGFSEPPDRCRPLAPVGFCEAGHPVLGRSSCGVRYCRDHWRDWCEDAVVSMVARLAAFRYAAEGAGKRLSHVVASPPQDRRYSAREVWETRSEAYEAMEAAGVRGGATVTHSYRTNDRGDALFATAVEQGDVDEGTGRWRFLRDLADGDWDELARYIEAAPHYHALAAAEDVDGEAAPDGWVVKRIDSVKPFHYRDTEAYRDMAARAYYVLTHGTVQQGRQTTTYFGDVHPAAFNPEEELTAAVWSRIQMEAEKAVKENPSEEGDGSGHAGEECPCEECEAPVIDLMYLPEYLDDDEWVTEILAHRDGRKRWLQLQGMLMWRQGRTDRPPPSVQSSEERLLNWLEVQGGVMTPEPRQASLTAVGVTR